jgi:hypothetical protein
MEKIVIEINCNGIHCGYCDFLRVLDCGTRVCGLRNKMIQTAENGYEYERLPECISSSYDIVKHRQTK